MEPAVGENRGVDAAGELAQLLERVGQFLCRRLEQRARAGGVVLELRLREAEETTSRPAAAARRHGGSARGACALRRLPRRAAAATRGRSSSWRFRRVTSTPVMRNSVRSSSVGSGVHDHATRSRRPSRVTQVLSFSRSTAPATTRSMRRRTSSASSGATYRSRRGRRPSPSSRSRAPPRGPVRGGRRHDAGLVDEAEHARCVVRDRVQEVALALGGAVPLL